VLGLGGGISYGKIEVRGVQMGGQAKQSSKTMRVIQQTTMTRDVLDALDSLQQLSQILVTGRGVAEFFYHNVDGVYLDWNSNVYTVNPRASIETTLRTLFNVFDASDMFLVENHTDDVDPSITSLVSMTWAEVRESYTAFQLTLALITT
jgi:hypothetical protein